MQRSGQNRLRSALGNVLSLASDQKIRLTKSGFTVDGEWGRRMPLRDLADGYKSTFYWVTDLWGWAVSHDPNKAMGEEISGIVLIDELEQHLHPIWQRYIIGRLREQFPKVQFIVTTHSPLVALGTADISDAAMVTLALEKGNRVSARNEDPSEFKGMRVDQALTSIFDLPTARSGDTGDQVLRFQELLAKVTLDQEEQKEFDLLRDTVIKNIPDVGEQSDDLQLHRKLIELISGQSEGSDAAGEK